MLLQFPSPLSHHDYPLLVEWPCVRPPMRPLWWVNDFFIFPLWRKKGGRMVQDTSLKSPHIPLFMLNSSAYRVGGQTSSGLPSRWGDRYSLDPGPLYPCGLGTPKNSNRLTLRNKRPHLAALPSHDCISPLSILFMLVYETIYVSGRACEREIPWAVTG